MFGQITEQFQTIFKNIRGLGKITDANINETVRKVRRALIDADVNFKVVKSFVADVEKKAQGTKVLKSIHPGQQFIKIIQDELVLLLDSEKKYLKLNNQPSLIVVTGLQGSGKTTTVGKLSLELKNAGKKVLMASADVYRPAAVEQLLKLGKEIDVSVYTGNTKDPLKICKNAIKNGYSSKYDVIILDTAGRIHNDKFMMEEIKNIVLDNSPDELLFVADGMTGQDAVNSALIFNELLPITGVILTKMDGDARGGAAVSIKKVTGLPIKFLGTSESLDGLELFDARRIANRILGFSDVVSVVEKAQKVFEKKSLVNINAKIAEDSFDLDDYKIQLKQIKKMGGINQLIDLFPGKNIKNLNIDDNRLVWTEAIISSMTKIERKMPEIINGSRRLRISKGSGRSVQEVNTLLNQFQQMKKMIKKMKNFKNLPQFGNALKFRRL